MKISGLALGLILGVTMGIVGTAFCVGPATIRHSAEHRLKNPNLLHAGTSDRYEDYVMCTGAVLMANRTPVDGVWMLDYRSGKLLGTVVDRGIGKIGGWAELDLVKEFGIPPKQNAHFMMTTGTIAQGQAALYVAETTSGKFGVYTLGQDGATLAGAGAWAV